MKVFSNKQEIEEYLEGKVHLDKPDEYINMLQNIIVAMSRKIEELDAANSKAHSDAGWTAEWNRAQLEQHNSNAYR